MQAGARGSAHAAAPCCSSSIQHRPVRAARRPARRVASQGDGSGDSGAQVGLAQRPRRAARTPAQGFTRAHCYLLLQATGPAQPAAPASPGRTQKQQKAKPAAPRSAPRARAPPPKSAAAAVHDQVLLSVDYGTRHTGLALGHRGVCRQLEVRAWQERPRARAAAASMAPLPPAAACSPPAAQCAHTQACTHTRARTLAPAAPATPPQVLANDVANRGMFAREVLRVAVGHQAQGILVGIPLDPYDPTSTISNPNSDTQHGRRCRYFAHSLAMVAQPKGLQVYLYGEPQWRWGNTSCAGGVTCLCVLPPSNACEGHALQDGCLPPAHGACCPLHWRRRVRDVR